MEKIGGEQKDRCQRINWRGTRGRGNLFKILFLLSCLILVGILFYSVQSSQIELKTESRKDAAQFDRNWNEFERDFATDEKAKAIYDARAKEAQAELDEAKAELKRLKEGR